MKLVLAIMLLAATASASNLNVDRDAVEKDLLEFSKLIPMGDIIDLFFYYGKNDAEFQNLLVYIMSEDFGTLMTAVQKSPEAEEFFEYLYESGLKIYDYINQVNAVLGVPRIDPETAAKKDDVETGGLNALLADIKKVVPFNEFVKLHYYKMEHSPAWNMFITRMKSAKCFKVTMNVLQSSSFKALRNGFKGAGIDVADIRKLMCAILGVELCT